MPTFAGFDHADVRVGDLRAVEPFYDALMPLLGLPRKRHAFVDAQGRWREPQDGERTNVAEYHEADESPGARFMGVIELPGAAPSATRIAFRLPADADWKMLYDVLAENGARNLELSADLESYPALFFEDPVGTRLELCWRTAQR